MLLLKLNNIASRLQTYMPKGRLGLNSDLKIYDGYLYSTQYSMTVITQDIVSINLNYISLTTIIKWNL